MVALMIPQVGASGDAPGLKSTQQEQLDAYAIYSMLLKQDKSRAYSPILGILQETRIFQPSGKPYTIWPEPAPEQRKLYKSLIEDFKRRNARPLLLQRDFDLPAYRLLTAPEEDAVGRMHPTVPPPPGTLLPKEDPELHGIEFVYYLSAVGFSPDHRRALVHIATWYGGQYYFLVKRHGKWITDEDFHGDVYSWVT
jgi:hypothetical protein